MSIIRSRRICWEDTPLRHKSSSRKYITGKIFPTNNYGNITIVGQMDYPSYNKKGQKSYKHFKVQFTDGNTTVASAGHILLGEVRNKWQPTKYALGFIGEGDYEYTIRSIKTPEGVLWDGIFDRCYSEAYHKFRPTYKDCVVAERWYNFQTFCKDIQQLEGYTQWKNNTKANAWQLDKDIKVKGNKVYSKDTCKFVTLKENSTESCKRNNISGSVFIGVRLCDGYKVEFTNQTEFAHKWGLTQSRISATINKKQKSHKGWTFRIKEEKEIE